MTTDWNTLQRYARVAGFALLLSIVFGTLGEMVFPGKIVVMGDANATAANLLANPGLVRVSFATYLVEGICDLTLAGIFYILLKPVNRNLALLSALFGIGAMLTYAVAQSSFYSASLAVGESSGMSAFSPEQRSAIAMLAVRISYTIADLFLILYGIGVMLRGYLIARSRYLPKLIGILFMIGGAGFILRTVTLLLAPDWSSPLMLIPMALGGIPLMLWLLIKGVRPSPQQQVA